MKFSLNSIQWESSLCIRTDMTKITGDFSAYANARAGCCLKQAISGSPLNGFGSFGF
jgi:hypothetical protein